MKFGLVFGLACLPASAFADDIVARMDIAAVTVSNGMAEITRTGTVDLPAGRHVLMIPARDNMFLPQIAPVDGVSFGAVQTGGQILVSEGDLDTDAQAQLRTAFELAKDNVRNVTDRFEFQQAEIKGLMQQLEYLRNLTKGGENGPAVPADLGAHLAQIGQLTTEVEQKILAGSANLREAEKAISVAKNARAKARAALLETNPFEGNISASTLPITVTEGGTFDLSMTYLVQGANWTPNYSIDLDTEAAAINVVRKVTLSNGTNAPWTDVAITLSTDNPQRRLDGTEARPNPVRIFEPQRRAKVTAGMAMDSMASPAPEAMIMADEARFSSVIQGMSLSYVLEDTVTVQPQSQTTSDFGGFELSPQISNAANPRFDETAFLLAETENDTGEPILPGQAYIMRDGALIGETFVDLIPQGDDIKWGFGPVDHLQLEWTRLERQEGDSGFIRKSNDQNESLRFTVTNLGNQPETVKAYYATPFSEQEDLTVSTKLTPNPTTRDVDDKRGVHVWEMELDAGEEQSVRLEFDLQWPENQQINWRP